MDIRYFLIVLVATLVGGVIGRFIAYKRRAKNKKPILKINLPASVDRALLHFFVFIGIFTLLHDAKMMFGANLDLGVIDSLEGKYAFLLGVFVVSLGGDFVVRRKKASEAAEIDSNRDFA